MGEIRFSKPRVTLFNWLRESKEQIFRLRFYKEREMRVYQKMKINLFRKAIEVVKKSNFIHIYRKDNTTTERRDIRVEVNEILTYLNLLEIQMNKDFELYRRGSFKYKEEVEEKWLNNVVCTG